MALERTLRYYDGLVFIHPDRLQCVPVEGRGYYLSALCEATEVMFGQDKPVFLFPWDFRESNFLLEEFGRKIDVIPSLHYRVPEGTNTQLHVLSMADRIGKKPRDVRLAAGGVELRCCIPGWMHQWCDTVRSSVVAKPFDSFLARTVPERRLGYGRILRELTEVGYLYCEKTNK
ncbi:TPA: hypothetical protein HA241_01160 [Candidatus Woesearchaeota archaeon]|nr:hypothetical protein [Candidatus Woesearchaeota archaeon]